VALAKRISNKSPSSNLLESHQESTVPGAKWARRAAPSNTHHRTFGVSPMHARV
jgi:hypothetical protein